MNFIKGIKIPPANASKIMQDYIAKSDALKEFVTDFPSHESLLAVARQRSAKELNREVLVNAVQEQYGRIQLVPPTKLEALRSSNSYTITTGHQLNIFGGPKYFIYKIVSVIKLCEEMNRMQQELNFIPVFWMATEDHDFEEINRVKLFDTTIASDEAYTGPVGRIPAQFFQECLEELKKVLGTSVSANEIKKLFDEAIKLETWADFTRYWVHHFFDGNVVIVDGDDKALKQLFKKVAQRELEEHLTDQILTVTNGHLVKKGYHIQVTHRQINLFALAPQERERIVVSGNDYKVLNHANKLTLEELLSSPEKISPNALLRPVYQEVILPNVAYVGGSGELSYWFQLKDLFGQLQVSFPILVARDSFLFVNEKDLELLEKLQIRPEELQLKEEHLVKLYLERNEKIPNLFQEEEEGLKAIFDKVEQKAKSLHRDYATMIAAEKARVDKFVKKMDLRVMRDAKFRASIDLKKLKTLQDKYFPGGAPIERKSSFLEEYIALGNPTYLSVLQQQSDPLDASIKVIVVSN